VAGRGGIGLFLALGIDAIRDKKDLSVNCLGTDSQCDSTVSYSLLQGDQASVSLNEKPQNTSKAGSSKREVVTPAAQGEAQPLPPIPVATPAARGTAPRRKSATPGSMTPQSANPESDSASAVATPAAQRTRSKRSAVTKTAGGGFAFDVVVIVEEDQTHEAGRNATVPTTKEKRTKAKSDKTSKAGTNATVTTKKEKRPKPKSKEKSNKAKKEAIKVEERQLPANCPCFCFMEYKKDNDGQFDPDRVITKPVRKLCPGLKEQDITDMEHMRTIGIEGVKVRLLREGAECKWPDVSYGLQQPDEPLQTCKCERTEDGRQFWGEIKIPIFYHTNWRLAAPIVGGIALLIGGLCFLCCWAKRRFQSGQLGSQPQGAATDSIESQPQWNSFPQQQQQAQQPQGQWNPMQPQPQGQWPQQQQNQQW